MLSTINRQHNSSPSPSKPLLLNEENRRAPLANLENDEEIDDREVVTRPQPGVDDGFFDNHGENADKDKSNHPDVELIPLTPKKPDNDRRTFNITPRLGPEGGSTNPDESHPPAEHPQVVPEFPYSPGFRHGFWDLEVGSLAPNGESIPDLNVYQHKKTLAQGMMDLALFSANANQLRYVVETFKSHPYYYPSLTLISLSLLMQVAVGFCLIWNATYNIKDKNALCVANRVNNVTTIFVFLVTVINVFISAFGVAPAPP